MRGDGLVLEQACVRTALCADGLLPVLCKLCHSDRSRTVSDGAVEEPASRVRHRRSRPPSPHLVPQSKRPTKGYPAFELSLHLAPSLPILPHFPIHRYRHVLMRLHIPKLHHPMFLPRQLPPPARLL